MLAGPYATMMLADLGAEVTKIEPPTGDISRQVSDSYFASLNRGKRSVCLELATEEGRRQLGASGRGIPCAAGESEAVGDSQARPDLRRAARVQRQDRLRGAHRLRAHGGDDPAFDYVVQAATGIAALTGDPDGPPTLPGYSSADNSTGLTAALGLLAQIISGHGGQVDVCLRDVLLSQLNYHASAYLNDGVQPQRRPNGAHSFYVPAQLFPTADGYLALFVTHDGFWRTFATEAGIEGFATMAERCGAPGRGAGRRVGGAGDRYRRRVGGQAQAAGNPCGRGAHAARGVGCATRDRGVGGAVPARGQQHPRRRLRTRLPAAAGPGRARSPHRPDGRFGAKDRVDRARTSISAHPQQS